MSPGVLHTVKVQHLKADRLSSFFLCNCWQVCGHKEMPQCADIIILKKTKQPTMASSFLKDFISLFSNSSTIQPTEHRTVIPDSWSVPFSFGLRGGFPSVTTSQYFQKCLLSFSRRHNLGYFMAFN